MQAQTHRHTCIDNHPSALLLNSSIGATQQFVLIVINTVLFNDQPIRSILHLLIVAFPDMLLCVRVTVQTKGALAAAAAASAVAAQVARGRGRAALARGGAFVTAAAAAAAAATPGYVTPGERE